jgi:hypothetical protein
LEQAIDSTVGRAHQHAAGVKGGIKNKKRSAARAAASRPKSTPHERQRRPLAFDVGPGEAHETQGFAALTALHEHAPASSSATSATRLWAKTVNTA